MICEQTKGVVGFVRRLLLSTAALMLAGCDSPRMVGTPKPAPRVPVLGANILQHPRASVILAWTNPPDVALAGNQLWQGGSPGLYTNFTILPVTESVGLTNLAPGVYYFAVTDTDTNGLASAYSNEIVWTNAVPPPVTNFLLSVTIEQSSDFTNWTTFTNAGQFQATNSGPPVYWRALMNIQPQ